MNIHVHVKEKLEDSERTSSKWRRIQMIEAGEIVRCASSGRIRWMTNVQRSTKLLVGCSRCSWPDKIVVRSSCIHLSRRHIPTNFVTYPRISKSALLAIKLHGRTCHGTISLVRSIIAWSITISAHQDARSVVGTNEFVFSAFRWRAGRRFVRFIVTVIFAVTFEPLVTSASNRTSEEAGTVHAKKNDSIVSSAVEGRLINACVIIALFRPVDETIVVVGCDAVSLQHPGSYQRKVFASQSQRSNFPSSGDEQNKFRSC